MNGLDTGFFVELLKGHSLAVDVWRRITEAEEDGICSCLTLFEIERLGLRGAIEDQAMRTLVDAIPCVCRIAWLEDAPALAQAARLSIDLGIPAVDALILQGLAESHVKRIYTTDSHFVRYRRQGTEVINLKALSG